MINVELIYNEDKLFGFKVYGHSGYDVSGRDIVCAAVSSVTQSVIVGLDKVICNKFYLRIDNKKPLIHVDVSNYNEEDMEKAQILLQTFKYTLKELVDEYKDYVKIEMKEDKKDEI
ncbi:ribosomal-processing cysteine protease Prp [Candidatus Arthromitus sp. SFB-rat-Yit]|uniref:ribosomal-processing cysteine protease Prp n=1 Tax=Candidatus Arthromitus sp. SFB-rat-Yit TaxID=1041504 RepID=UPI000227A3E2|nr:ribosomal-processing cysteine protease Prp [Candidatus Arthromitus sp. SFB-rat-Yit]BAK80899.1 hypothetical protein RATSFB_0337 [Candidatus Arthromitus sp. SFB-rat-Yit]